MEKVQATLAGLIERINMQEIALKGLEVDVSTMRGEIQMLGQVDEANCKATMQKVTHLQHKRESML